MALVSCSCCGHTISTLAPACPRCGASGDIARAGTTAPAVVAAPTGAPPAGRGARKRAQRAEGPLLGGWTTTTKALVVVGALALALLGAMLDAAIHRVLWRDSRPAAGTALHAGEAAGPAGPAGTQRPGVGAAQGVPDALMDTVREYEEGTPRGVSRESELRLALGEVARKQEQWLATNHYYASSLDALGFGSPRAMHVWLTAGPGWWSATATHDDLPGVACTGGVGAGHTPGKVTCVATDSAGGHTP